MTQNRTMERACPGQDIISELPDMILLHILTLLPRKYAIRTGILSSKWKDLWKQRFPHPTTLTFGRATQTDEDQIELAREIQEDMTRHGKKRIEAFNLYFYPGKKHEQMAAQWVEQAATNGVEEFHLDFSQCSMGNYPCKQLARKAKKIELKESLFKGNNILTTLNLNYCRLQRYFKFRYFSCLEILCLHQVNINDFMLGKLVSNCPRLESLELRQCSCLKHIRVPATLLRLKKLEIARCFNTKVIDISAPMLHSFYFFGYFPYSFVMFENMPFLSDVVLLSPSRSRWLSKLDCPLVVMLHDHVQVLTLDTVGLSVMFGVEHTPTWVVIEHLKELQLLMNMMVNSDLNNIYRLFQHCQLPLLEKLFVELPTPYSDYNISDDSQKLQDPPEVIFKHLKIIKMNNFKGLANEMLLLNFLLQSAINLDRVILVFSREIYMDTTDSNRQYLFNDIMLKPKASEKAQIVVFYTCPDDYGIKPAHSNVVLGFQHLQ